MPRQATNNRRPVYFSGVVVRTPENPKRLDIVRHRSGLEPPADMLALWADIGATARLVVALFEDDVETRTELFEGLYIAALSGLVGPNYSVSIGRSNLATAKLDLADKFPAARARLYKAYLWSFAILLAVCASAAALFAVGWLYGLWGLTLLQPDGKGAYSVWYIILWAVFGIPLGASFGIFLEYMFSVDREFSFETLSTINPKRWNPTQVLINTVVTAIVFAGFMALNAFQIGLASLLLNEFASTKPWMSLAVGFVTGFAFPYVRDLIFQLKPAKRETPATA